MEGAFERLAVLKCGEILVSIGYILNGVDI